MPKAKRKYGDLIEIISAEPRNMPPDYGYCNMDYLATCAAEIVGAQLVWAGRWFARNETGQRLLGAHPDIKWRATEVETNYATAQYRSVGSMLKHTPCEVLNDTTFGFHGGKLIIILSNEPMYRYVTINSWAGGDATKGEFELYFTHDTLGRTHTGMADEIAGAMPLRAGTVVSNKTGLEGLPTRRELYAAGGQLYSRLTVKDVSGKTAECGWKATRNYLGAKRLIHRVRLVPGGHELLDMIEDARHG